MTSTAVSKTIENLRTIFAAYGIPEQVVSDNGSQFTSKRFAEFIKGNGIHHIRTAPYHPSSNGAVERLVQSFKRSLNASGKEGRTINHHLSNFLFSYRTIPHATTGVLLCELLLNRSLQTQLDLLKPSLEETVSKSQAAQKRYHDSSRLARTFKVGEKVLLPGMADIDGIIFQSADQFLATRHVTLPMTSYKKSLGGCSDVLLALSAVVKEAPPHGYPTLKCCSVPRAQFCESSRV